MNMSNHFPQMLEWSRVSALTKLDFSRLLRSSSRKTGLREKDQAGMKIALASAARITIQGDCEGHPGGAYPSGSRPFIVPAMGSHGGATAAARSDAGELRGDYRSMGVPIEAKHGGEKKSALRLTASMSSSVSGLCRRWSCVLNRVKSAH